MGVFDKMLTPGCKQAFLEKKAEQLGTNEEYLDSLCEYISGCECDHDIRRLMDGVYFLDAPTRFFVRKSHSDRRRIVYSFQARDKYLLQYMTFVLMDLDGIHCDSLCSFRRSNRTRLFFQKVRKLDNDRSHYVMKADIHDFGGSVDQDEALRLLRTVFADDPAFFAFLTWLLTRNEFYRRGKLTHERISIIEGLPLGCFIQSVYLDALDRILEANAVIYMRYTDDIAFFTDSREKAEWALEQVRRIAAERKLTVNEKKTAIIPPRESVELLGIEVYAGGLDIGENAVRKLLSKFKRYRDKELRRVRFGRCTRAEAMEHMIRFADRSFFGIRVNDHEFNWVIHAFPIVSRMDQLHRLDSYIQDCIRVVGSGKLGNAKYRIRYKDMCAAGYRSLVHAYYHGYTTEEVPKDGDSAYHADSVIG